MWLALRSGSQLANIERKIGQFNQVYFPCHFEGTSVPSRSLSRLFKSHDGRVGFENVASAVKWWCSVHGRSGLRMWLAL